MSQGDNQSREVKAFNRKRVLFPVLVAAVVLSVLLAGLSVPMASAAEVASASAQVASMTRGCTLPSSVPTISMLAQEFGNIQWQNIDSFSVQSVHTTNESVSIMGFNLVGHQIQVYSYAVNGTVVVTDIQTTHFRISFDSLQVFRNSTLLSVSMSNLHISINATDTAEPNQPTFTAAQLSGSYSVSCR